MHSMFKSIDKTVADNRQLDLEFETMLRERKDYSDIVELDDGSPRVEWVSQSGVVSTLDAAAKKDLTEADWKGTSYIVLHISNNSQSCRHSCPKQIKTRRAS